MPLFAQAAMKQIQMRGTVGVEAAMQVSDPNLETQGRLNLTVAAECVSLPMLAPQKA